MNLVKIDKSATRTNSIISERRSNSITSAPDLPRISQTNKNKNIRKYLKDDFKEIYAFLMELRKHQEENWHKEPTTIW